jgi:hypothetical protein
MLYHWGAYGLFAKCLYAVFVSVVFTYAYGLAFLNFPEPTEKALFFIAAGLVIILFWETVLIIWSMIVVRRFYQNKFSIILLAIKSILVFLSLMIFNSVVVACISIANSQINFSSFLNEEEFLIAIIATYLCIHILFGTYCFIRSTNKWLIFRTSVILALFVPLPGCASKMVASSSLSRYWEEQPNTTAFSSFIEKFWAIPNCLIDNDSLLILLSILVLSITFISIVEFVSQKVNYLVKNAFIERSLKSVIGIILFVFLQIYIFHGIYSYVFPRQHVSFIGIDESASIYIDGMKYTYNTLLSEGEHDFKVEIQGYKKIIGHFFIRNYPKEIDLSEYKIKVDMQQ